MGSIRIGDEYVAAVRVGDSNSFPDTHLGVDVVVVVDVVIDVDVGVGVAVAVDMNAAAVDSGAFEKKQVAIR